MNALTDIGSNLVIPPLLLVIIWLSTTHRISLAAFLGLATAGSRPAS